MSSPKIMQPIPVASVEYDARNETVARRTIEQNLQDLATEVSAVGSQTSTTATLAMRRHQFLLMGASSG